jgi:leukotriene-A4 hydrolase
MALRDPHSYCDDTQPRVASFAWKARVDFASRTLDASVTLKLAQPAAAAGPIDLDTRELTVREAEDESGRALRFELSSPDPILGARLRIELPAGCARIVVRYRTQPTASALQWLEPAQTQGKRHPFLFSQCQAIHARSVVPLQDTPAARITYTAELTVPLALRAVMAAGATGRTEQGAEATEQFSMPQPIPPYLFAFAVGELASKDLSPRSRVWAEPGLLEDAAWEFAEVERLIETAERLFGPYDWERFDILTMPPSFPYGGMENPRLTFLTPTLLAKDRSLVNVLAHELAHSWTGNLVTNANAEHFWLNEGFTVFAERRILEALEGAEMTALHAALGFQSLKDALERFSAQPELTKLRTRLQGVDPDEAFSQVPYEKGYLFLKALESAAGRPAFDAFLRQYLQTFRFQALTTEQFLAFTREKLPGALEKVDASRWLDSPGLPADAPLPRSARLDAVKAVKGAPPEALAATWSPAEWQLYLEVLPRPVPAALCAQLDDAYALTRSRNSEVLVAWLTIAVEANHAPALARAEEVLKTVGRMKYLRPLYQSLTRSQQGVQGARALFEKTRSSYHPIAQRVIDSLLR